MTRRSTTTPGVVVVSLYLLVVLVITTAGTWTYASGHGRVVDVGQVSAGSTALVLGSLVSDGEPGTYVQGRLDTAVDLYESGSVRRIINSGNGSPEAGDEPAVMGEYLRAHGVAEADIVADPLGLDTAASCRRARTEFDVHEVVVITQDFHLARAIGLCRAAGIDAIGVVAPCESCSVASLIRNHIREPLAARPRALLSAVLS